MLAQGASARPASSAGASGLIFKGWAGKRTDPFPAGRFSLTTGRAVPRAGTTLGPGDENQSKQRLHLGARGGDKIFGLDGIAQVFGEEFEDLRGMGRVDPDGKVG